MRTAPILEVQSLSVRFGTAANAPPAVNGLDLVVRQGEVVALVGESGCGKSTTAHAIAGLLPSHALVSGKIRFDGKLLSELSEAEFDAVRGRDIGIIFQEPMAALNPVYTVGQQIAEVLRRHLGFSKQAARGRAVELLDLVRMSDPRRQVDSFPHQLSGGQRQRALIAIAIACQPRLLIADEPTSALDAAIQMQILETIDKLRREMSMGLLLIAHDLPLVARRADRVIVMHHGEALEELPGVELLSDGQHPYTKGLVAASLRHGTRIHYSNLTLPEVRARRDTHGQYSFAVTEPASPPAPAASQERRREALLEVDGLVTQYESRGRVVTAVDNVSFQLAYGETVGLVGESGSGKSTIARSVARLVTTSAGSIRLAGTDLIDITPSRLRDARRQVQVVFQDPYGSLNPRHTVFDILGRVLSVHGMGNRVERRQRIVEALDQVGLPSAAMGRYPHEFSGGQRQRVSIARALILRPSLVICDEPVSALDVSIQAQILNLLVSLRNELGLAYLFISHDLAVVEYIADRILVMKSAKIVEELRREETWQVPMHPYTQELVAMSH